MRTPIFALLAISTLGGCIIYEKDVWVHRHDEEGCWEDPKGCEGDQPGSQPGDEGGPQDDPGQTDSGAGEGEGEGEGDGGEGEGEDTGAVDSGGDTGATDTGGGEDSGAGDTGGDEEEDAVWTFWPNEIQPGQTLLSSLTTYPPSDYAEVADVQVFDGLEVCGFTISSTEIYVAMAASADATPGAADALVVMMDGTAHWVPSAITILEGDGSGDVEDTGAGETTGCD